MVNEERLRHMIQVAKFDANEEKRYKPMTQYARKDYVSLKLLGSFVSGSICYGLLVGMWGLYSMEELLGRLNRMDIPDILKSFVLSYLLFLVLYLGATYIVFNLKYSEGRRHVKKYYSSLKKVNQLYEREERLKTTDSRDRE